jgi:hypothetical protein
MCEFEESFSVLFVMILKLVGVYTITFILVHGNETRKILW